jgi:N-acetyl-gamma-glutamyl-phosphate reductase
VESLYRDCYADRRLVRIRSESPEIRHVRGSAYADIAVKRDGDTVVAICAIDNLGKGAAAQAVQCLNLTLGLPAHAGLGLPPCTP